MPIPLHSATAITNKPDPLFPSAAFRNGQWDMAATGFNTGASPFFGEIVSPNWDNKTWAEQAYERDHKDWRSLGRIDKES